MARVYIAAKKNGAQKLHINILHVNDYGVGQRYVLRLKETPTSANIY